MSNPVIHRVQSGSFEAYLQGLTLNDRFEQTSPDLLQLALTLGVVQHSIAHLLTLKTNANHVCISHSCMQRHNVAVLGPGRLCSLMRLQQILPS